MGLVRQQAEIPGRNRSVLFVDDDVRLRRLVPEILTGGGYRVEAASTVSEALGLLKAQSFDIVLSDLHIGEPGDGFTVVSAARRVHPQALTLIITGFPDFKAALEAIRRQADDYLVKPVAPPHLLHTLEEKLRNRGHRRLEVKKRVSQVLRDERDFLVAQWLSAVKSQPDFAGIPISDEERIDKIPKIIEEVIIALESDRPEVTPLEDLSHSAHDAAQSHGRLRRKQGYSIRMLLREARILQREIYRIEQAQLLEIDISQLIPDMIRATDTLEALMTEAVSAYVTA